MRLECPRCRASVPQELWAVHQCRNSMMAPTPSHHAPSHRPYLHNAHMSQPQNHHPQHAGHSPAVVPAFNPPSIAPGFRHGPSDSDPWRRQLGKLRDKLLGKIEKSSELAKEDKQICCEYVNSVKVYQNLMVYTYAHLKRCANNRSLLNELQQKVTEWRSWYHNDLMVLTQYRTIKDVLMGLLDRTEKDRCPVHVSVKFTPKRTVPYDDGEVLRILLVLCGRDYENEFYGLADNQAQNMVDLLEDILRDTAIDHATHARLLRYTIRLSRKSGRLPCQLLLDGVVPHLMRVVGEGGFATIYTASYNHQAVAIKRSHYRAVGQCRKDFVSEAVIWSHLKHDNIVTFKGVIEQDQRLWLVSPFMYNGNVRSYLEHTGREHCDLRHLATGVAKGLSYLHSLDPPIVHSDLKGCNVLVDDRKNACLADFGVSMSDDSRKILDSTDVGRRQTLQWTAPEIFFGNTDVLRMTLETDMYAFACVLYEIYTGNIPFQGEELIKCLRAGRRPSLEGLEKPITRLIEACWQDDARLRMKAPDAVDALKKMKKIPLLSMMGL
ncbi:kinase-like domain-containing protein [Suillus paluster]|uniref:kinase-like domain-containing protein n=1 Tax=Suillus paluster TaxID=48578 RepID=UPI001B877BFD|nr:kinase-like domain-containing protein [Suillus paluster]KAG1756801.1 kinase-like domain-containing protein [Suillus paluster]